MTGHDGEGHVLQEEVEKGTGCPSFLGRQAIDCAVQAMTSTSTSTGIAMANETANETANGGGPFCKPEATSARVGEMQSQLVHRVRAVRRSQSGGNAGPESAVGTVTRSVA